MECYPSATQLGPIGLEARVSAGLLVVGDHGDRSPDTPPPSAGPGRPAWKKRHPLHVWGF